jgi:hypothetical protein
MRAMLSFENYENPAGIPAEAALDDKRMLGALNRAADTQNEKYKRLAEKTLSGADLDATAWYVYGALYGEGWTADELKQLIAFYATPLGQKTIERDSAFHLWEEIRLTQFLGHRLRQARADLRNEELMKTNPARLAADAMRLWGVVIEQYAFEHDDLYPTETDPNKIQTLVGPPEYSTADPWGTPLRFEFSVDRKHYRISSAGDDRKFQAYGAPWASKPRIVATPGTDVVFEDGVFVLYPPGATDQKM